MIESEDNRIDSAATLLSPVMMLKEAAAYVRLSEMQIRALEKEGKFPQHVRLSEKRIVYVRAEVERWLLARLKERRSADAQ